MWPIHVPTTWVIPAYTHTVTIIHRVERKNNSFFFFFLSSHWTHLQHLIYSECVKNRPDVIQGTEHDAQIISPCYSQCFRCVMVVMGFNNMLSDPLLLSQAFSHIYAPVWPFNTSWLKVKSIDLKTWWMLEQSLWPLASSAAVSGRCCGWSIECSRTKVPPPPSPPCSIFL